MREYRVQGLYGYWSVEEYRPGDGSDATYSTVSPINTKKLATSIAAALNNAYRVGRKDTESRERE